MSNKEKVTPEAYWIREKKIKLNRGFYYIVRLRFSYGYYNYELTINQMRQLKKNGWFWQ